jgi:hypothetical protein
VLGTMSFLRLWSNTKGSKRSTDSRAIPVAERHELTTDEAYQKCGLQPAVEGEHRFENRSVTTWMRHLTAPRRKSDHA